MSEPADWQSASDLGVEMNRPVRWVQEAMKSGEIPGIKLGGRWYFTPECRAELMRRHLTQQAEPVAAPTVDEWGRDLRGRA